MNELLSGMDPDMLFHLSPEGALPKGLALTDNDNLLTLNNGTRLDAAIAFVITQRLRDLLDKDVESFAALRAAAEGGVGMASNLRTSLQQTGLLDEGGQMVSGLSDVLQSIPVKPKSGGGYEVGSAFAEDDEAQQELWVKQLVQDRLRQETNQKNPGSGRK